MRAGREILLMTPMHDVAGHATSAAILLATLLAGGCIRRELSTVEVASDAMTHLRTATNLPDRFIVATPAAQAGDCPPQLRDGGLHTTLRLQRSLMYPVADSAGSTHRVVGDYTVEPAGRYGEGPDEGLRVECGTLRAVGVVQL